jgi:hypothetical protein
MAGLSGGDTGATLAVAALRQRPQQNMQKNNNDLSEERS